MRSIGRLLLMQNGAMCNAAVLRPGGVCHQRLRGELHNIPGRNDAGGEYRDGKEDREKALHEPYQSNWIRATPAWLLEKYHTYS